MSIRKFNDGFTWEGLTRHGLVILKEALEQYQKDFPQDEDIDELMWDLDRISEE